MKRGMGSKVLWAVIAVQLAIGGLTLATIEDIAPPARALLAQEPNAGVETYSPGTPRPGTYRRKVTNEVEVVSSAGYPKSSGSSTSDEEDSFRIEVLEFGTNDLVRFHMAEEPLHRNYRDVRWRFNGSFGLTEVVEYEDPNGTGELRSLRDECRWQPEPTELAFPIGVGRAWSWDATCAGANDDGSGESHYVGISRVTGASTAVVDGRAVPVLTIERQSVRSYDGTRTRDGARTTSQTEESSALLFAPSISLHLQAETTKLIASTFDTGGQVLRSKTELRQTSTLLSLDPT